jgi:hypothetical protein
MLLTTIGHGAGGGGGEIHSMIIFLKLLNIVRENNFLNFIFLINLVLPSFPLLLLQFHYPSLLNDIQIEILICGQQMRMEINSFNLFIFQLWMNFIQ